MILLHFGQMFRELHDPDIQEGTEMLKEVNEYITFFYK